MSIQERNKSNFNPKTPLGPIPVYAEYLNEVVKKVNALSADANTLTVDTVSEKTSAGGVTIDGVLVKDGALSTVKDSMTEVTTTVVLTAADSGKTYFNNADSGASTFTLPAPAAGLRFKWIWAGNKTTATIIKTADITDTTGDMFVGGLLISAAAAVNTFVEAGANVNTMTFDDDVVNGAGGVGSWVEVYCTEDPTWVVTGVINSTTDADGVGSAIFTNAD